MSKSNRDAAKTMGSNVLDMAMVREGVAKLSDNAGPAPVAVIGSRTYAAGEYPDPETSRRAERAEPLVMAFPLTMETTVRVGQRHERFTTHDRDTMRAVAAVAHPRAQVQYVATDPQPYRGTTGGIEVTVKAFLPYDMDGDVLRDLDAVNEGDNLIAQAARRLTGKRDAAEVIEAIGRHHVREVNEIPYALGLRDGEDFPPEMREAIGQRFGLVPPSSLASRPYNPSRELRWNDPTCAALFHHGATEAQACEELAKLLRETQRAAYQQRLERDAAPMVVERRELAKPTYERAAIELADSLRAGLRTKSAVLSAMPIQRVARVEVPITVPDLTNTPRTWTFTAPPADLRSLHDAIGQAIEVGTGRVTRFNGGPVVVTRDELLFSPTVGMDASGGLPATVTIAADSKHLRMLRDAVDEARETGKAPPREWGKGRQVAVERVGDAPKVAAQATTEPVRYDGNQGGAQAWRWEVGE